MSTIIKRNELVLVLLFSLMLVFGLSACSASGSSSASSQSASSTASTSSTASSQSSSSSAKASSSASSQSASSAAKASTNPADQITFSNLKFDAEKVFDGGGRYSDQYFITLTGTMKYDGTTPLASVTVKATCTEVEADKYNEDIKGCELKLDGSMTSNIVDETFYDIKPQESRPFKYKLTSSYVLKDPTMKVSEVQTTLSGWQFLNTPDDFTLTTDVSSDGKYAIFKNNTDKYFEKISLDYYGVRTSMGLENEIVTVAEVLENVRPGAEVPFELFSDSNKEFVALLNCRGKESTSKQAVTLEQEFPYTISTDEKGNVVVTLTNKTGKYLSYACPRYYHITDDGKLFISGGRNENNIKPDGQWTYQITSKPDDPNKYKVFDVRYEVDKSK